MKYYKAVRVNGWDFATGATINYGKAHDGDKIVTWRARAGYPWPGGMIRNDATTYLSVSTEPGEVLLGGQWPCRLFAVTPVGAVMDSDLYKFKTCCRRLVIDEELPAWQALGPNGEQVAGLIAGMRDLTPALVQAIADSQRAEDRRGGGYRDPSRQMLARQDAKTAAIGAARHAALVAAGCGVRTPRLPTDDMSTWRSELARLAAGNAARALVVRDLITPQTFKILYGPWEAGQKA